GRLLAQLVVGPVDVGVVPLVELGQRVHDVARLLGGVGAVEVDERPAAADRAVQDREVLADARDVEGHDAAPALTHRSWPAVSSVSASSWPPSSTRRPPTTTCAQSG